MKQNQDSAETTDNRFRGLREGEVRELSGHSGQRPTDNNETIWAAVGDLKPKDS